MFSAIVFYIFIDFSPKLFLFMCTFIQEISFHLDWTIYSFHIFHLWISRLSFFFTDLARICFYCLFIVFVSALTVLLTFFWPRMICTCGCYHCLIDWHWHRVRSSFRLKSHQFNKQRVSNEWYKEEPEATNSGDHKVYQVWYFLDRLKRTRILKSQN